VKSVVATKLIFIAIAPFLEMYLKESVNRKL